MVDAVKHMVEAFYSWDENSIDKYYPIQNVTGDYVYYPKWNDYLNEPTFDRHTEKKTFTLTNENPLGPFNETDKVKLYEVFMKMKEFVVTLQFYGYYPGFLGGVGKDRWTLKYTFDFSSRGYVSLTGGYKRKSETIITSDWLRIALDSLIIIVAVWSTVLYIRSIVVAYQIMVETRVLYKFCFRQGTISIPWEAIPFKSRMRFFNYWYILFLICNALSVVGAAWEIATELNLLAEDFWLNFSIGLAAFFGYLCIIRFLEWSKKYYMLIYALRAAIPVCIRFFEGVIPVYLAFGLFGVAVFSEYVPKFSNLFQAIITLFGMMNGDALIEAFHECYNVSEFVATVYLFSFIIFFIMVVLNLFVAIIEEAYHLAKRRVFETGEGPADEQSELNTAPSKESEEAAQETQIQSATSIMSDLANTQKAVSSGDESKWEGVGQTAEQRMEKEKEEVVRQDWKVVDNSDSKKLDEEEALHFMAPTKF